MTVVPRPTHFPRTSSEFLSTYHNPFHSGPHQPARRESFAIDQTSRIDSNSARMERLFQGPWERRGEGHD